MRKINDKIKTSRGSFKVRDVRYNRNVMQVEYKVKPLFGSALWISHNEIV